jgi:hypothetical protein
LTAGQGRCGLWHFVACCAGAGPRPGIADQARHLSGGPARAGSLPMCSRDWGGDVSRISPGPARPRGSPGTRCHRLAGNRRMRLVWGPRSAVASGSVPRVGFSTPVRPVCTSVSRVPFDGITNRSLQQKSACRRSVASALRSPWGAYADWKLSPIAQLPLSACSCAHGLRQRLRVSDSWLNVPPARMARA